MINKIYFTSCGYCVNDIKHIFKDAKSTKMKFPANCFVFEHSQHGTVIFDTGYTSRIYERGLINKIYTWLNPTFILEEDTLVSKLTRVGIMPEKVSYVILSHLHPDHIGGLKDFSKAKIIISRETFKTYKENKKKSLIFTNQIPEDFEERLMIIEDISSIKKINTIDFYNFFGEEILLFDLSGHTKGQIGLYLPKGKLLVVADAYWMNCEIKEDKVYTFVTKLIMADYDQYKKSHERIRLMLSFDDEINVVSSHEEIDTIEELGYVVKAYDTQELF